MVDQEVVDILAEIRDKVRANKGAGPRIDTHPESLQANDTKPHLETNGFAGLTVLSRAWDRLPPLVTKRRGRLARLDLWLKGLLKKALRWLTWEQVNFNAATHQTFIEVIDALNRIQEEIGVSLPTIEHWRANLLHEVHNLERQLKTFETQLGALQSDLRAQQKHHTELVSEHTNQIQSLEQRFVELVNEYHSLVAEFRDRDERLFDEQRISLKQFSFELSESHVLQDRVRRELEKRIAKLEKEPPTT